MTRYDELFERRQRAWQRNRPDPWRVDFAYWGRNPHPDGRIGRDRFVRGGPNGGFGGQVEPRHPRGPDRGYDRPYRHGGFVIGPNPGGSDIGYRPPDYIGRYADRYGPRW